MSTLNHLLLMARGNPDAASAVEVERRLAGCRRCMSWLPELPGDAHSPCCRYPEHKEWAKILLYRTCGGWDENQP